MLYRDDFPVDLDKGISEFLSRRERRLSFLFWFLWKESIKLIETDSSCNFSLSEIIIYSTCKCVNIPVRSRKTRLFQGVSPPEPPPMFRHSYPYSRSQGGPQAPCLVLESTWICPWSLSCRLQFLQSCFIHWHLPPISIIFWTHCVTNYTLWSQIDFFQQIHFLSPASEVFISNR